MSVATFPPDVIKVTSPTLLQRLGRAEKLHVIVMAQPAVCGVKVQTCVTGVPDPSYAYESGVAVEGATVRVAVAHGIATVISRIYVA